MAASPDKPGRTFVAAANITSDEVIAYHDANDHPVIGAHVLNFHGGMRAAGHFKKFLEPPAYKILVKDAGQKFKEEFAEALNDPAVATKLQNSIAIETYSYALSFSEHYRDLLKTAADVFRRDAPHVPLPVPPNEQKSSEVKQYRALQKWLSDVAALDDFNTAGGSRLFQRCMREACRQSRAARESQGTQYGQSYDQCAAHVLKNNRWLPSSQGEHTKHYKPLRLTDYTTTAEHDGISYAEVDAAKLQADLPLLQEAAVAHFKNVRSKLREVRDAAGISHEEFIAQALKNSDARALLKEAMQQVDLKSLGGRMALQALSDRNLHVVMVDRTNVEDYRHSFNIEKLHEQKRQDPAGAAMGYSDWLPFVCIGCKIKRETPSTAVEELVHYAFKAMYENDHYTYARETPPPGYYAPEKQVRDESALARKAGFEDALKQDLERLARIDGQGGSHEEKIGRAKQRLRKDIDMSELFYKENSFGIEIATKIIAKEAVGEWDAQLERRWPKLSAFVHDKIGPDVDSWIARENGTTTHAPANASTGHAASIKKSWKPESR